MAFEEFEEGPSFLLDREYAIWQPILNAISEVEENALTRVRDPCQFVPPPRELTYAADFNIQAFIGKLQRDVLTGRIVRPDPASLPTRPDGEVIEHDRPKAYPDQRL